MMYWSKVDFALPSYNKPLVSWRYNNLLWKLMALFL